MRTFTYITMMCMYMCRMLFSQAVKASGAMAYCLAPVNV